MNFKDIPEDDFEHLLELRTLFHLADEQLSYISNETRDKMLEYHTENHTLPHCVRWGSTAADDLVEAALGRDLVDKLRTAMDSVLTGDGASGLDDIQAIREKTDESIYAEAVKQLKRTSK
jgi:hypothetical protein